MGTFQRTPVLVVDDDADERLLLRAMLEREGCEVAEASDGAAALEVLRSSEPAIIILDLEMPEMNGLRFLEAREAQRLAPTAHIVVHSGHLLAITPEYCHRLVKPVAQSTFSLLIRALRARPPAS